MKGHEHMQMRNQCDNHLVACSLVVSMPPERSTSQWDSSK